MADGRIGFPPHIFVRAIVLTQKKGSERTSDYVSCYYDGDLDVGYRRFLLPFLRARGATVGWSGKHDKTRAILKEAEDQLFSHRPVHLMWLNQDAFMVVLGNLSLITYNLNTESGDLLKVSVDKSLSEKTTYAITSVAFFDPHIIMTTQTHRLLLAELRKGSLTKPIPIDLHMEGVTSVDVNCVRSMLVATSDSALSVAALSSDAGRSTEFELIAQIHLAHANKIRCSFSRWHPYRLHSIEETIEDDFGHVFLVLIVVYEINAGDFTKTRTVSLQTCAPITAVARNGDEDKLVLGCANGEVILFCERTSQFVRRTVEHKHDPCIIRWHPADGLFLVGFASGDICFFDAALSLLHCQRDLTHPQPSLDLAEHLSYNARVEMAEWVRAPSSEKRGTSHDSVALVFDRGPAVVVRIELGLVGHGQVRPRELVAQYLGNDEIAQATDVLNSLENREEVFLCLTMVADCLLRQKTRDDERLLALFERYWPLFGDQGCKYHAEMEFLLRRSLHQFLLEEKYEQAIALALKIDASDLFSDIRTMAQYRGEIVVADLAAKEVSKREGQGEGIQRTPTVPLNWRELAEFVETVSGGARLKEDLPRLLNQQREHLSTRDAERLGLWLESEGRFEEALDVYVHNGNKVEEERLHELLTVSRWSHADATKQWFPPCP